MKDYECGTYQAFQAHQRRGEPIDDACRQARNAYVAALRRGDPARRARQARAAKTRYRAMAALAEHHPEEYEQLYEDEARKLRQEGEP